GGAGHRLVGGALAVAQWSGGRELGHAGPTCPPALRAWSRGSALPLKRPQLTDRRRAASSLATTAELEVPHHGSGEQFRPDRQRFLIDVERRAVMGGRRRPGRCRADERERARDLREEERHVLSAHRTNAVNPTLGPDD